MRDDHVDGPAEARALGRAAPQIHPSPRRPAGATQRRHGRRGNRDLVPPVQELQCSADHAFEVTEGSLLLDHGPVDRLRLHEPGDIDDPSHRCQRVAPDPVGDRVDDVVLGAERAGPSGAHRDVPSPIEQRVVGPAVEPVDEQPPVDVDVVSGDAGRGRMAVAGARLRGPGHRTIDSHRVARRARRAARGRRRGRARRGH